MSSSYELLPAPDSGKRPASPATMFRPSRIEQQSFANEIEANRLTDYVAILRRRKLLLFAASVLGVVGALGFSLLQPPEYRATASVEVEGLNENFLDLKGVQATLNQGPTSQEAAVGTEVKSLKEDSLIERVVVALGLPYNHRFMLQKGLLAQAKERLGVSSPLAIVADTAAAVAVVKDHLAVEVPRQGRIIRIQYEAPDPVLAAEVANTLAHTLIQQKLETRLGATEQIGEWLNPQLAELKQNLANSEELLQRYAQSQGLLLTENPGSIGEQNLRLLQEELAKARADRIVKQAIYERAALDAPTAIASNDENRVLQENQLKLTDLRRQVAELSAVLRPENYKVQRVQAQITELESAQKEERGRVQQRVQREYGASLTREQLLANVYSRQEALVADQSVKGTKYENLRREVEVNRRVYEAMLQKVKEAGIASAIQPSGIRMVTAAKPPSKPYKPNFPLNLGVGLFAGLALGLAYVVASAQSDRKLRAPGEAELYLNLPELGAIPRASRGMLNGRGASNGHERRVELTTTHGRPSVFSESFRATLASLLFTRGGEVPPAIFVVTSPLPAEGKTTVVSNLGVALAEMRRRVLLVDADLRGPQLHKIFSLENDRGLTSLLAEQDSSDRPELDALIRTTEVANLYVLPSGPEIGGVASLLHSARLERLLERLRERFDHVIVDAPPCLLFADARILARSTDGVVLVLRANSTSWPTAVSAAQRLQTDGVRVLGTVLNDWSPQPGTDAYSYRSYEKYYSTR
jgi:polysaccharide biosynthesis transport protein